jgi:hypothetical protein
VATFAASAAGRADADHGSGFTVGSSLQVNSCISDPAAQTAGVLPLLLFGTYGIAFLRRNGFRLTLLDSIRFLPFRFIMMYSTALDTMMINSRALHPSALAEFSQQANPIPPSILATAEMRCPPAHGRTPIKKTVSIPGVPFASPVQPLHDLKVKVFV